MNVQELIKFKQYLQKAFPKHSADLLTQQFKIQAVSLFQTHSSILPSNANSSYFILHAVFLKEINTTCRLTIV